tara:strand:+ start:4006 stop:4515 length:510 start_codon:yes stop_codon:yes gene_type:complete
MRMRHRRLARERAIQFLFQYDLNPPGNREEALDGFWSSQTTAAIKKEKDPASWGEVKELPPPSEEDNAVRLFGETLINGVLDRVEELDSIISKEVKNWDIDRIAKVDRSILRLAIYEMFYREDIPPVVTINEAIDIAKKFSTEKSGSFVNGILDKIKAKLMRPSRSSAN